MAEYKTSYDNQDDIPESVEDFRALFTEKSGKFELTGIGGIKSTADVARLEEGIRKERELTRTAKEGLAVWGDLSHEDVQAKLDRIPELEAAAGDKLDEAGIEAIVQKRVEGTIKSKLSPLERENKRLAKENGTLADTNAGFVQANTRRSVHDAVRTELTKAKVVLEAHEDALMLAERVFEVTEEGGVLTRDGVGVPPGLDPAGWLGEIQDKKPHWWPASVGGGARGSSGPGGVIGGANPWTKAHWSTTDQGQYFRKHGAEKTKRAAESVGSFVGAAKPPEDAPSR